MVVDQQMYEFQSTYYFTQIETHRLTDRWGGGQYYIVGYVPNYSQIHPVPLGVNILGLDICHPTGKAPSMGGSQYYMARYVPSHS